MVGSSGAGPAHMGYESVVCHGQDTAEVSRFGRVGDRADEKWVGMMLAGAGVEEAQSHARR